MIKGKSAVRGYRLPKNGDDGPKRKKKKNAPGRGTREKTNPPTTPKIATSREQKHRQNPDRGGKRAGSQKGGLIKTGGKEAQSFGPSQGNFKRFSSKRRQGWRRKKGRRKKNRPIANKFQGWSGRSIGGRKGAYRTVSEKEG